MSITKHTANILLLICIVVLGSCEFSQESKTERKGIATEDINLVAKLETDLSAAGIPYELTKPEEGLVSVKWDIANDEKAKLIVDSVSGMAPKNTNSLCFLESNRFQSFVNNLEQHNIPFEITNPNTEEWCARWKEGYDDEVASIDSNWHSIRKLESQGKKTP